MLVDTEVNEMPGGNRSIAGRTLPEPASTVRVVSRGSERRGRTPLRWRRLSSLLLMASGLGVFSVAALVLIPRLDSVSGEAGTAPSQPAPAPAPSDLAIGGPQDVAAQTASYAPGQSSGWHSHTGLHAVVVLSGTLTIVDGECRRQTYGPGDSYVGGRDVHLALNDTASPLEMAVTYMFPAGVPHTGFHVPAAEPAVCGSR